MTDFADRTLIESLKEKLHEKEREVQRAKQWSRRWKASAKNHRKLHTFELTHARILHADIGKLREALAEIVIQTDDCTARSVATKALEGKGC